jgi:putative pyruvate formate lyase activating enzyme
VTGHRLGTILAPPPVFRPAYLELLASGVLDERVDAAWVHLRSCDLCARYCRVSRFEGIEGAVCRSARIGRSPQR